MADRPDTDSTPTDHRDRDGGGLWYVADGPGRPVRVANADATRRLMLDGGPVGWPIPGADAGPLAAGVVSHLTGIARPMPPLVRRLADEVLDERIRRGGLQLPAEVAHRWVARAVPGLAHDRLPGLDGAAGPPAPPATYQALAGQAGRDVNHRLVVAEGRHRGHRWQGVWLLATGEVLSVVRNGTDTGRWPVTRLACNVRAEHALDLALSPAGTLGDLLDRYQQLKAPAGGLSSPGRDLGYEAELGVGRD